MLGDDFALKYVGPYVVNYSMPKYPSGNTI